MSRQRRQRARAIRDDATRIVLNENDRALQAERPRVRGDCQDAPRPCPWVTCRFHLAIDINPLTGTAKWNFPAMEVWEMENTCALDIADQGGVTLESVGKLIGMTRERIRQIEGHALVKLHLKVTKLVR